MSDGRGPSGILIGILAGILVFLLLVWALIQFGGPEDEIAVEPTLTGSPVPGLTPTPTLALTATPTPTTGPAPTATPTPTPSATAEPTPTEGSQRDPAAAAEAFAEGYEPPGAEIQMTLIDDLDDDDVSEVLISSVAGDVTRLDVAAWDGEAYTVVATDQGGPADRTGRLVAETFTGDATVSIVVEQSRGAQGASLSLWAWDGRTLVRQEAVGGCWGGSHTYGVVGAHVEDGELTATCDGSPLPTAAWPSDIYLWDGDAWAYDRTREPG